MKLTFSGGAGGVTGSKTLLEHGNRKYLVDYGMHQGSSLGRERNWLHYPDARNISAVFLTHAHIDHSGLLPRLYCDGFRGKIYCTLATFNLCKILLEDSAKIHQEDAEFANKKQYSRHRPALPLYTSDDVSEVLKLFVPIAFEEVVSVASDLEITFFWAGHILGSSFIRIVCDNLSNNSNNNGQAQKQKQTIVFSGDIGHNRNILLTPPHLLCPMDFLVLESTYGGKLHSRIPAQEVLGLYLNTILKRSGVAIIPSFSVGRTQEVLFLVKELMALGKIPTVPVYLDSPLSKKANSVFNSCLTQGHIREEVMQGGDIYPHSLHEIDTVMESRELSQSKGPMIIISASGMIEGGRVVHHIKNMVSHKENGIILVGFQPEGTKGRLLIDGEKNLRLHKEEIPVRASIFAINSLSAHGDYLDLLSWMRESAISPKLIILNHGEPVNSDHFKAIIEAELELKTTVAGYGESFELGHYN